MTLPTAAVLQVNHLHQHDQERGRLLIIWGPVETDIDATWHGQWARSVTTFVLCLFIYSYVLVKYLLPTHTSFLFNSIHELDNLFLECSQYFSRWHLAVFYTPPFPLSAWQMLCAAGQILDSCLSTIPSSICQVAQSICQACTKHLSSKHL